MQIIAKRFNAEFLGRWRQIIDFLKLHYVLSSRSDSRYWRDNRLASSIPDTLRENLSLWQTQPPWYHDDLRRDDMFPAASYQYVLYGMGFKTNSALHTQKGTAFWSTPATQSIFDGPSAYAGLCSGLERN
jgi:tryptophan halogenase